MLFSLNLLNLWFSIQKSMAFIVPLSDVLLYGLEPAMEASSHDTAHQELTEVRGEGEDMPAFACGLNLVVTSVRCPSHLKSVRVSRDHAGICFSDLLRGYSFRTFEGRLNWNMPGDNSLLWLRTRQTGNLFVSIEAQVNVLQLSIFELISQILLIQSFWSCKNILG